MFTLITHVMTEPFICHKFINLAKLLPRISRQETERVEKSLIRIVVASSHTSDQFKECVVWMRNVRAQVTLEALRDEEAKLNVTRTTPDKNL